MLSCHSCAVAIQNGDTSHINEDDLDATMANIERLGMVTVTETGNNGYFQCSVCDHDTMSDEYLIEQI